MVITHKSDVIWETKKVLMSLHHQPLFAKTYYLLKWFQYSEQYIFLAQGEKTLWSHSHISKEKMSGEVF